MQGTPGSITFTPIGTVHLLFTHIAGMPFQTRDGDSVIICEDDGAGIKREQKEQIFDKGVGKNSGFGLFLSREVLDITGMSITENGEPGKGARFEIVVPKGAWRVTGNKQG